MAVSFFEFVCQFRWVVSSRQSFTCLFVLRDSALALVLIRVDTAASTHVCSGSDALLLRLRAVNNDRVRNRGCALVRCCGITDSAVDDHTIQRATQMWKCLHDDPGTSKLLKQIYGGSRPEISYPKV